MSQIFNIQTIDVIRPRPSQAPDGWLVFNAPRPLYGTLMYENRAGSCCWIGDSIFGRHYAAVNPQDPQAAMWVEHNIEMHATLLNFITQRQVMDWAREFCSAYPEVDVEEMGWDAIHFSYFIHHQPHETEITLP